MKEFNLEKVLPFRSHYATVAGFRMHYLDEGSGPVVLLLHGNPTWSFFFRSLVARLSPRFRVIAPDYIGCGLSDHPAHAHFRAVERVGHLQELLRQLGVTRFSLVMHDWGGSIGTALAVRDLSAVERLVYLNTTLTETDSLPRVIRRAAHPLIGKFLTKHSASFLRLTTEMGVARSLPHEVKQAYLFPYRSAARRTAIWDFVADIPFDAAHPSYPDMQELARRIPELLAKPVQIVWGLKDPCFHREMLSQVARHFPHAEVLEIADASHLVLEDAPDRAGEAILRFLSGGDSRSTPATGEPKTANTLYREFSRAAKAAPSRDAVVAPRNGKFQTSYGHTNYEALSQLVNKYQRGLASLGLQRGDRVLMLVPPGVEFLALSYAVMGRGGVPVFVDPGMGRDKLMRCITDAAPDALIGTPKAQALRLFGKRLFPRLKFHITASEWVYTGGRNLAFLRKFAASPLPEIEAGEEAFIAFTSGATGAPKGVIFTNEMLATQLEIFRRSFGVEEGARSLPLLPIFAIFDIALGMTSICAPVDPRTPLALDPARVVKIIRELGVRFSFGSPTLWRKIAEYCMRGGLKLESLKSVLMAGAPVPAETLRQVQGILEGGDAFTPYGATEALPVTAISGRQIEALSPVQAASGEQGTPVGTPVPGVELKIVEITDGEIASTAGMRELPARSIGEVIVRGANVSTEYVNRPDATRLGKIPAADGGRPWHRMGDLGYLDDSGNLYFCGRKMHRVVFGGRQHCSVPIERLFNQCPDVHRSALIALAPDGRPAIVVEPDPARWPSSEREERLFRETLRGIAAASPLTAAITDFFFHRSFPVDARHNAKIYREQLGAWASTQTRGDQRAA